MLFWGRRVIWPPSRTPRGMLCLQTRGRKGPVVRSLKYFSAPTNYLASFQNYEQLEQHFKKQHFPCTHPACLEQKFVVFTTMLDLQGHQVEVHGEQMSSRDRRDARRVDTSFVFGMESGRGGRGGRGGYRGDSGARPHINEPRGPPNGGRAREPPPHAAIQPPPQPGPPPGSAPSAPTPRGGSRRAAFGASLTVDGANTSDGTSTPAASQQEVARPTPPRTPDPNVDPETAEYVEHVTLGPSLT